MTQQTTFNTPSTLRKTAVALAALGLATALTSPAMATGYDIQNGASPIPTIASSQNSINVYSSTDGNPYSGNILMNLAAGVDLTGQVVIGATPWAVFTSKYTGADQWVRFSDGGVYSALSLNGNNEITGTVGWYIDQAGANANGAASLDAINVSNTGNIFNSQVFATDINLNSGSSVQFLGNIYGDLNYNGSNSVVTLGNGVTLSGNATNTSISNSSLIFNGSGTITGSVGTSNTGIGTVQVNGNNALVRVNGNLSTDHLDYQAASTVAVVGNLYLNVNQASNGVNGVTFGNTGGTLQVDGNIVGVAGKTAVATAQNNTGKLVMISGNPQTVTGNIGASGLALATLQIGGTGSNLGIDTNANATSSTTVYGDVYATTIYLSNDSTSNSYSGIHLANSGDLSDGYDLNGAVITEANGRGSVVLDGGHQFVRGTVGTSDMRLDTVLSGANNSDSTFTGAVYASNVNNSGTGASVYEGAVGATTVNVGAGTSTFQSTLNATTTNIGTGKGVFNGTTTTAINFTGAGTADLNQGLAGTIAFGANAGTVNLADGKTISGAITSTNAGTLNALGGGTLDSTVGTLAALNVNTAGSASKTLQAKAHIAATSIGLFNDGVLNIADGANVTGAVTTDTDSTGSLTFDGTSTVTGDIGQVGEGRLGLLAVHAGATGKTVTFNSSVVIADTLSYTGNGTVVMNGHGATAASYADSTFTGASDLGFVGTVDFGTNLTSTGTLTLGNNVDLITAHDANAAAHTQTAFSNANGATLRFDGSSVVTGDLGSAANTGNENFKDIYAGQAIGDTVSLRGDVYVASTTFHVGAGVVNLLGNLNGPMVFDADGSANVADGKGMTGIVTTATHGTGTLNFVGSATTQAPIGTAPVGQTAAVMLKAVNFHASTTDSTVLPVTSTEAAINIGHDVYAMTTTVGNATSATTANLSTGVYLGNTVELAGSNVTLNTAGVVSTTADISPVDFGHTKLENGHLQNTATVTQSAFGSSFSSNGATMNFAVATSAWDDTQGGGLIDANASSRLTGASGSSLTMTGEESITLSLLGSMRDGANASLIAADTSTVVPDLSVGDIQLTDNSFVVDTSLSLGTGAQTGDLVVTATRADEVYITRSDTHGDISNPAALRLGQLAAAGTGYSQDLQTVLNKIDIDQWGFGNTQAKLANQAKSLAPVANGSIANAGLDAQSYALDQIGSRLKDMREVEFAADGKKPKSVWMRNLMDNRRQDSTSAYDGYKTKLTGFQLGGDISPSKRSLIGVAISSGSAEIAQHDFRAGELANVDSTQLSVYGSYDFTDRLYADAMASTARLSIAGVRGTAVGRQASYNHDAKGTAFKLNLGYKIPVINEATSLTPVLSFQRTSLTEDAYLETGAGDVGLSVAERKQTRQETGLGLRLATTTMLKGYVVKPELAIMRTRDNKALDAQAVTASYLGDLSATTFDTSLATAAKPYANKVQLGMSMLLNKSSALSLRYEHTNGSGYKSNKGELAVRWNW